MARSVAIAAYVAGLGGTDRKGSPHAQPPRPDGTIVWARCSDVHQLTAIETLGRKITAEGDPVHIIATLQHWDPVFAKRALPEPLGRNNIRAFIKHWRPAMVVWVHGDLNALLMSELDSAKVPAILVDATTDGLDHVAGTWVPGALRAILSQFEAVLTLDQNAAEGFVRAGAPSENVVVTGAMEDAAPTLPCDDDERSSAARAIGTRPIWLAAGAHLNEWAELCEAQQEASHRAHRLLLIVAPQNPVVASPMAEHMRAAGFNVARRSQVAYPTDMTEIFIIDAPDELGLWYRVAPITYMGGTLLGGGCRDPFEATALGSAVLYGPQVDPFQRHAARLNAAGASRLLRTSADLGPVIESLLAPDKTAEMAHAAWDVTSRGANTTNRIAAFIQSRLEELVA